MKVYSLNKKSLILFLILLLQSVFKPGIMAQEKQTWRVDFRADLYWRHLWRGDQLGDSPAFEPEITFSKGNFGLSVWGANTFNNSYSEIDIILNYKVLPFMNLSLYDYYNPVQGAENKFLKYSGSEMRHTIELTADLEKDDFPLSMLAGVFLYGDKDSITAKERFSTYIETGYKIKIIKPDLYIFAGLTPFEGYYARNSAFINLGATLSESFSIGKKIEIPAKVTFCGNPYTNKTWLVFAVGIKNRR